MKRLSELLRRWAMRRWGLSPALPGPSGLTPAEKLRLFHPDEDEKAALLGELHALGPVVLAEGLTYMNRLFQIEHAQALLKEDREPRQPEFTEAEALIFASRYMRELVESAGDVLATYDDESARGEALGPKEDTHG